MVDPSPSRLGSPTWINILVLIESLQVVPENSIDIFETFVSWWWKWNFLAYDKGEMMWIYDFGDLSTSSLSNIKERSWNEAVSPRKVDLLKLQPQGKRGLHFISSTRASTWVIIWSTCFFHRTDWIIKPQKSLEKAARKVTKPASARAKGETVDTWCP